ncbi:MAG: hypothetical protein EPO27_10760 [Betaproteobacteria bacterium]|nr:MAG: hypothetical protein EPO27_10760 [Betaproteobacteria bacterium]
MLSLQKQPLLWRNLLLEPERFSSPDALDTALTSLEFSEPLGDDTTFTSLGASITASALKTEPFTITAGQLQLTNAREPRAIACQLETIPTSFRTGFGWLLGARHDTAHALGCHLAIDDAQHAELPTESATDLQQLGLNILRACASATQAGLFSEEDLSLLSQPVFSWTDPTATIDVFLSLGRVSTSALISADPAELERLLRTTNTARSKQLINALLVSLKKSSVVANQAISSIVLRHTFDDIDIELAQRLDPQEFAAALQARGSTLSALTAMKPGPPAEWIVAVWLRQVALEGNSGFPQNLIEAITHLRVNGYSDEHVEYLVGKAIRSRIAAHDPAWPIVEVQKIYKLSVALLNELAEVVKERIIDDFDALLDYVALGADPGGVWLASAHAPLATATTQAALEACSADFAASRSAVVGDYARAWLVASASTSIRTLLPISAKLQIAQLVGDAWTPLLSIDHALRGLPSEFSGTKQSTKIQTRDNLLDELRQLLSNVSQQVAADFRTIERIVGPEAVPVLVSWVTKDRMLPSGRAQRAWLKIQAPEIYWEKVLETYVYGDFTSIERKTLDLETWKSIVARLLVETRPSIDAETRRKLQRLQVDKPDTAHRQALREAINATVSGRMGHELKLGAETIEVVLEGLGTKEGCETLPKILLALCDGGVDLLGGLYRQLTEALRGHAVVQTPIFLRMATDYVVTQPASRSACDQLGNRLLGLSGRDFRLDWEEQFRSWETRLGGTGQPSLLSDSYESAPESSSKHVKQKTKSNRDSTSRNGDSDLISRFLCRAKRLTKGRPRSS